MAFVSLDSQFDKHSDGDVSIIKNMTTEKQQEIVKRRQYILEFYQDIIEADGDLSISSFQDTLSRYGSLSPTSLENFAIGRYIEILEKLLMDRIEND